MTTVTVCKVCEHECVGIVRQCPGCGSENLFSETRGTIGPLSTEQRLERIASSVRGTIGAPLIVGIDSGLVGDDWYLRPVECVCGRCTIEPFADQGVVETIRCAPVQIAAAVREAARP